MIALIATVLLGLGLAYFATQNTGAVILRLDNFTGYEVPLYAVVIGSMLVGLLIAWILSLFGVISSKLTIHNKETELKRAEGEIAELTKRVHQLELENVRLKRSEGEVDENGM